MEMCLGDQQFVTLLLYLDAIGVFAASIDEMLYWIELFFFLRLKGFNLTIKSKEVSFLSAQHSLLGVCFIISANPEKV